MDLNIGSELTWAHRLTRGKRNLSVTPLRCRDRRLVHRHYGADSLGGDREIGKLSHVEQIQLAIMIRDGLNEYPDVVPPETHRKCCGK